jgi:hypothetical protein
MLPRVRITDLLVEVAAWSELQDILAAQLADDGEGDPWRRVRRCSAGKAAAHSARGPESEGASG